MQKKGNSEERGKEKRERKEKLEQAPSKVRNDWNKWSSFSRASVACSHVSMPLAIMCGVGCLRCHGQGQVRKTRCLDLLCLLTCTRVLYIAGNARKQVPNIDPVAVAITWYLLSSSEVTVVFNDVQLSDFSVVPSRALCEIPLNKNRQNHCSRTLSSAFTDDDCDGDALF